MEMSQLDKTSSDTSEASLRWSILCVDDEPSVLNTLRRLLRSTQFNVFIASSAAEALDLLTQEPIDIVISDMRMPVMNGAEFLTKVVQLHPDTYRILLTGFSDIQSTVSAINEGKINRYVQKPWNNDELKWILEQATEHLTLIRQNRRLTQQVILQNTQLTEFNHELEEKVSQRTKQLRIAMQKLQEANHTVKNNLSTTVKTFYNIMSLNEHIGGQSAVKIAELATAISTELGLDKHFVNAISLAGLLSEIGLVGYPKEILSKPIEEFTLEEKQLFLTHPLKAFTSLAPATVIEDAAKCILHQYDRYDKAGMKGDTGETPVGAKILAIARDFTFAMSGKLKGVKLNSHSALSFITENSGTIYDPAITALLPKIIQQESLADHNQEGEKKLTIDMLLPNMKLARNLFNKKDLMLIPEGHIFTFESIERLKKFLGKEANSIDIYISEHS